MSHFVMVCEGKHPVMPIANAPDAFDEWRTGRPLAVPVSEPLIYTLDKDYPGLPKAMYYEEIVPAMRDDVVDALKTAGVDNIEYFRAILRNPLTNSEETNYKAFNIVGVVAAADMGSSELMGTSNSTMRDVDFHSLTLDEDKAGGLLLFRLAEALNAIVVHEKVRRSIEDSAIPGFVFYGPGEWSG
jgi:hypothetical protein